LHGVAVEDLRRAVARDRQHLLLTEPGERSDKELSMADEDTSGTKRACGNDNMNRGAQAGGGAVYGLGLIGASVYYVQHASSFGDGLLGLLKAIVWPAFLIYHAMGALRM
jgi:hypothetical protein